MVTDTERKCYYCPQKWEPSRLADRYLHNINYYTLHVHITEGEPTPQLTCFMCDMNTLILDVIVDKNGKLASLCFTCAEVFTDLGSCGGCGDAMPLGEDGEQCSNCWSRYIS